MVIVLKVPSKNSPLPRPDQKTSIKKEDLPLFESAALPDHSDFNHRGRGLYERQQEAADLRLGGVPS
jgi:hypothetical protein